MKNIALLTALILTASISYADDSVLDYSDDLLYACDAKMSWFSMSMSSPLSDAELQRQSEMGRKTEHISTSDLIIYSAEDKSGNSFRTASKKLIRKCGDFKITLYRGFLNANPNGELGAVEFPLVQISAAHSTKPISISIGTCEPKNSRYNYSSECPSNWATEIEGNLDGNDSWISLNHSYSEIRSLDK